MSNNYHIGKNGPSICKAKENNCPLGGEHGSLFEIEKVFETMQGGLNTESVIKEHNSKNKILSQLVDSGNAHKIPANDYIVVMSSDVISESFDWPYIEFDDNDEYTLDNGAIVSREYIEHINSVLNDSTIYGSDHGFNYGVSLKTSDQFKPEDLKFMREHNFVIDYKVENDSILVDANNIDDETRKNLNISDEEFYPIIDSKGNSIDLNNIFAANE